VEGLDEPSGAPERDRSATCATTSTSKRGTAGLFGQLSDPLNLGKFEFIRLVTGTPGSGLTPPPGLYPNALFDPFFFATEGAAEAERRAGGPIMQNLDHSCRSPQKSCDTRARGRV
jgi:hypothetical protein